MFSIEKKCLEKALKKRKLRRNRIAAFQSLKVCPRAEGVDLFSRAPKGKRGLPQWGLSRKDWTAICLEWCKDSCTGRGAGLAPSNPVIL